VRELVVKMAVAGVLFGAWPLLMNRSGLNGPTSVAALNVIVLLLAFPIAWQQGLLPAGPNWWFVIAAGCCAGLGYLAFNSGIAKAAPAIVGQLVVIMIVIQMAVPAAYQAMMNGQLTIKAALGFAAAAIAAILLV
jgi:hypothetical protein